MGKFLKIFRSVLVAIPNGCMFEVMIFVLFSQNLRIGHQKHSDAVFIVSTVQIGPIERLQEINDVFDVEEYAQQQRYDDLELVPERKQNRSMKPSEN